MNSDLFLFPKNHVKEGGGSGGQLISRLCRLSQLGTKLAVADGTRYPGAEEQLSCLPRAGGSLRSSGGSSEEKQGKGLWSHSELYQTCMHVCVPSCIQQIFMGLW